LAIGETHCKKTVSTFQYAISRFEKLQLTNLPKGVFSPSFFQGTAGIGYELLRLAYSEVLPSVLLWE
jgi:lantibiotic modifying enzyme